MNKRLAQLVIRRLELLDKIESQRMELADISLHLQKPLAVADVGLKAVRYIYNHPALVSGGVTALLTLRNKGLLGLAKHGWRLLFLYPSAIFFGLKYLTSANRAPAEERNIEVL
jgi:hypothetical protein